MKYENEKLKLLLEKHGSFSAVARELGISRERARVICNNAGLFKPNKYDESFILACKNMLIRCDGNQRMAAKKIGISIHAFKALKRRHFPEVKVRYNIKFTKQEILDAYDLADGNITQAGRFLRMRNPYISMHRYIKYYDLKLEGTGNSF